MDFGMPPLRDPAACDCDCSHDSFNGTLVGAKLQQIACELRAGHCSACVVGARSERGRGGHGRHAWPE